ncbi:TPA: hypothetical protein HA265_07360 [Candidatus Woesearchaeota archaeon]|nr:hypothetical protein [Candidatus Woesearchaeota archaeon]
MRFFIFALFVLFIFLLACAPQKQERQYAVAIYNLSESDVLNEKTNNTMTKLSFIVKNQEPFSLDCQLLLVVDHETEGFKKKGSLGILEPGASKPAQFSFELPMGESGIDVMPVCAEL